MQSRSSTSATTTILIVLLLVFTFPFWIGLLGGLFGLVAGMFGAMIGILAGVFGALMGAIGAMLGWIFDWDWHYGGPFGFWNTKLLAIVLTMLIVFFILIRPKKN
jgi:hypothetical protein